MNRFLLAACIALTAFGANAAGKKAAPAPAATPVAVSPEDQTSALFYSTCAASMGSKDAFTKEMDTLVAAKTVVKMTPDSLKGQVSDAEAQNAWAAKGFADSKKPLLLTYNAAQNICGMHVADIEPEKMRHAFQADLKKLVDLRKASFKIAKPQTQGDLKVLAVNVTSGGKTQQLGLAISAAKGEEFLTAQMQ